MSELGNRLKNSTTFGGQKGPARDAWNNPIDAPPERTTDNNNNNNNNNNDDNKGGNKSNDATIDDDAIDNIWSDIKAAKPDNSQDGKQQQQQQTQQPDPKVQLQNYLKEAGLGDLTLSEDDKNQLKEGNFDNLTAKVLGLVQQAHVKALSGASTLIDAKVKAGIEAAMKQTRGFIAGKETVDALNTALPFTKDKAIGPVAQTIMQRFLDRGLSQEDAIEGVKRWFDKTVGLADPDRQVNGNRNSNFRGGSDNRGKDDTNWINLLSPKSR